MTKVTAHAGCEGTPKGSLESIEAALRCGADAVEMDLRILDGEIYLSHDPIRVESLHTYLTFRQALEVLRSSETEFNCDLKEIPALPAALRILRDMGMERRAFFTGETGNAAGLPKQDCRCFLNIEKVPFVENGNTIPEKVVCRLIQLYQDHKNKALAGFNVEYTMLTAETTRMFREAQVPLSCWLVNDEEAIGTFLKARIAYLTTDRVACATAKRARP